jgi:hypothetical protein
MKITILNGAPEPAFFDRYLAQLKSALEANTRPAGKGQGRQKGFRPAPRKRYQIVFKTKKSQNQPKIC